MKTTVQILRATRPDYLKWAPQTGPETDILMSTLNFKGLERAKIIGEATNVLGQCINPKDIEKSITGLILGYVQSGKTVSFTTAAAMARDNGFQIVIVIAGTTIPLLRQSRLRLERDLSVHRIASRSPWFSMPDPTVDKNSHASITGVLEQWADPEALPRAKRTLLITVMKHHRHLQNLVDVLTKVDLRGVPVLIIDDEGDQAGLNTKVRIGEESTTYEKLSQLRAAIPNYAYLQYTATPQALLLINIMNWLSPDFVEVLSAGKGYVGGKILFKPHSPYTAPIPAEDNPTSWKNRDHIPKSLTKAIRIFLLGCAVHALSDAGDRRSMMIHPSSKRLPHDTYFHWVSSYCDDLKAILAKPEHCSDRVKAVERFRPQYDDLTRTVEDLPSFDIIMKEMKSVLRELAVLVFNAGKGKTPEIRWDQQMYWILVGGKALDRGFTVEGLTVTYMPRGLGIGNADNLQQRGRFFGYKEHYLGFCRIYLENEVRIAFEAYVESEENIRSQLEKFRGKPLQEWRRQFAQTALLRPTRRSVIDVDYSHLTVGSGWVYPKRSYENENVNKENRILLKRFIDQVSWRDSDFLDDRGKASHRNLICRKVLLKDIVDLLISYRTTSAEDSAQLVVAMALLHSVNNISSNKYATVLLMAGGHPRYRDIDSAGKINTLFQGAQYRGAIASRTKVYMAEHEMRDADRITVHLSWLNLGGSDSHPLYKRIPHIAIYLKESTSIVIQPQGG